MASPSRTIVGGVIDSDMPATPSTDSEEHSPPDEIDLDAIEADFIDVERALARLADGTYWTDEVTGEALPDDVLAANPTTRRHSQPSNG